MDESQSNYAAERAAMVDQQLRLRGIRDQRVLSAMRRVPRERFISDQLTADAYEDSALPIECGQTISQPVIVGLMSEALELAGDERVLEIGTGSGYQTAILTELAGQVYSIERHQELADKAASRLTALGKKNWVLKVADGSEGWPDEAPFDRILITAAAPDVPPALWDQLAEGGVLVGPFGPPSEQTLLAIHKRGARAEKRAITGCRFVPLVSGPPG